MANAKLSGGRPQRLVYPSDGPAIRLNALLGRLVPCHSISYISTLAAHRMQMRITAIMG